MKSSILFISYTSLLAPILSSQGLPLLFEMSRLGKKIIILSFEKKFMNEYEIDRMNKLKVLLKKSNISWFMLRYHNVPIIPSSTFDILNGIRKSLILIKKFNIKIIHTRSYIPAAMALFFKFFFGIKFIFDMRGLMPEEYISVGFWTKDSINYKIAKSLESKALLMADAVVVTSNKFKEEVLKFEISKKKYKNFSEKIYVIPNCVDTKKFKPNQVTRSIIREKYSLNNRKIAIFSSGGLKSWHLPKEIISFFYELKSISQEYFLLMLTNDTELANRLCVEVGLDTNDYLVISVPPDEVHNYLSTGDIGLCFVRDGYDLAFPIKLAEYLACGLPVVVSAKLGGGSIDIEGERVGIEINDYSKKNLIEGAIRIIDLLNEPNINENCYKLANQTYSLDNSIELYLKIYNKVINESKTKILN